MPKKFATQNSKAVEAKARKAEKADSEKKAKQKAIEDEYWKDDDKSAAKKKVWAQPHMKQNKFFSNFKCLTGS